MRNYSGEIVSQIFFILIANIFCTLALINTPK